MKDNQRIIVLPRRFKPEEDLPAIISTRYRCGDFEIEEEAFGDNTDYWWGLTYTTPGTKGRFIFHDAVGVAYFRTDDVLAQGSFQYTQLSGLGEWEDWRKRHFDLPPWNKSEYFVYFYTGFEGEGPVVIRCADEKVIEGRQADRVLMAARFRAAARG